MLSACHHTALRLCGVNCACRHVSCLWHAVIANMKHPVIIALSFQIKKSNNKHKIISHFHDWYLRQKDLYTQVDESALIKAEEGQGFILTQTLCEALKQYELQRDKYATMNDFMPVYAQSVNDFDLKQYKKQQKELAKLNATYKVNIKNGAKNVPSGLFHLVIKFSKPMVDGIALYNSFSGADFPPFKSYAWRDDKTLEVVFLLEPSHQYGFAVMGSRFITQDGHTGGRNTEINFTTGK